MKKFLMISMLAYTFMAYAGQNNDLLVDGPGTRLRADAVMSQPRGKKAKKQKKAALDAPHSCRQKSIVILYDNDVHCAIDGYAKIAGLRDAISDTAWVAVVSNGDYIQGGTPGAISKGQYIIDVMRAVNYDAITLGNHEYDYKVPRMFELLRQLPASVVCANMYDALTGRCVFAPYAIKQVGEKRIAFIGAVTPSTMESEAYAFYDDAGKKIYDLQFEDVYQQVQRAADEARRAGADYVIVNSHLGEVPTNQNVDSHGLIANTRGIDVVLDGHTHSTIETETVMNKEGKPVLITQTGTQFANIGKLLITPDGKMSTSLYRTEDVTEKNAFVAQVIDSVYTLTKEIADQKLCHSDVDFLLFNEQGRSRARFSESNAGNLVTDAFRYVAKADIAFLNGGAIRNEAKAGDLTYGDLVSLLPYDNYLVVVEAKGALIVDMLNSLMSELPNENGQFPQTSGLRYTGHVSSHSVSDVAVLNAQTGQYEPIDPERTYTLAVTDYCVTGGGFNNKLKDCKVVKDAIMIYSDAFIKYVTEALKGHIGEEYGKPQGRITIVE